MHIKIPIIRNDLFGKFSTISFVILQNFVSIYCYSKYYYVPSYEMQICINVTFWHIEITNIYLSKYMDYRCNNPLLPIGTHNNNMLPYVMLHP